MSSEIQVNKYLSTFKPTVYQLNAILVLFNLTKHYCTECDIDIGRIDQLNAILVLFNLTKHYCTECDIDIGRID